MNKVFQSMRIAFRALRVNKLRSALTMLGIIIGVGAVIAMVSVGSGATDRIHLIFEYFDLDQPEPEWIEPLVQANANS